MAWWSPLRQLAQRLRDDRPAATPAPIERPVIAPAADRGSGAWGAVPPVQRALEPILAPVAPLDRFTGSLSAWRDPRLLQPLTHDMSTFRRSGLPQSSERCR